MLNNPEASLETREKVFIAVRTDAQVRKLLINIHALLHLDNAKQLQEQVGNSPYLSMLKTDTVLAMAIKKICRVLKLDRLHDTTKIIHETMLEQDALVQPLADALKLCKVMNPGKKIKTQLNHVSSHFVVVS